jgi:hypothetical protein
MGAMTVLESLDAEQDFAEAMADARLRLERPVVRERVWPALTAAAFFAASALVFATAAILAPPAHLTPVDAARGPF